MGEILRYGETPEFEESVWWGLSVGSLAYAVKAKNSQAVIDRAATLLGTTAEGIIAVPTIVHPHEDSIQPVLDEKYPNQDIVRIIPFSV